MARFVRRGPELIKKLELLRKRTEDEMEPALLRAGEVIADEQRRLAPVKSGKLKDSIQVTTGEAAKFAAFQGSRSERKNKAVRISAGNSRVRYAHLVEFGTSPHKIIPVRAPALHLHGNRFVESVDHPGAAAHPFFFPGYRATRKKARAIINKAVRESVKKAVK